MTKQDILNYVQTTPQNTNPAILFQMLDEFANENGSENNDFSTAEVTIVNSLNSTTHVFIPYFYDENHSCSDAYFGLGNANESLTVDMIMYKGEGILWVGNNPQAMSNLPNIVGNAEIVDAGEMLSNMFFMVAVTGDCTITIS